MLACGTNAGGTGEGPALWRVQSPSATVYLFGTKHILAAPEPWFTPRIAAAFAASRELRLELAPGGQQAGIRYAVSRGFDPAYDLQSHLPDGVWPKLRPALVACGIPDAAVSHTRPWFVVVTLFSCSARLHAGVGFAMAPNLALLPDLMLANLATAQGKPVGGLESWDQQFASMADLPDDTVSGMFRSPAVSPPTQPPSAASSAMAIKVEAAWLHGDVATLGSTVMTPMQSGEPLYYGSVVTQRNARFADAIAAILAGNTTTFVAIGAGHLVGSDSVLALLGLRGFHATRIE